VCVCVCVYAVVTIVNCTIYTIQVYCCQRQIKGGRGGGGGNGDPGPPPPPKKKKTVNTVYIVKMVEQKVCTYARLSPKTKRTTASMYSGNRTLFCGNTGMPSAQL